ncbi:glucose/arabinose dehydrogenase [Paucimonas lemoignei]|uniref:Glucose/arabinose dehydrogenase n=1 Tax=Paucimonas lemoignei TaxID=29443 RepID=A0A4R3HTC9_PAULE|nr:sugar dehydrogenase [Paucimonas lemoignei]TCS36238.1 glucose/arabinose dehydrogenase [Paucimonas lemoignei]
MASLKSTSHCAWLVSIACLINLGACSGGGDAAAPIASQAEQSTQAEGAATPALAAASVLATLDIPASLTAPPFDVPRQLTVPPGFGIRLWARVEGARFMARAPNGDILVSQPGSGQVVLLRERSNDLPQAFTFASGLQKPHDLVFHTIGTTTYLYIAESNRITRSVYQSGDTRSATRETVVADLPDASNMTELQGNYAHELKNIALSPEHKLYVSIASSCNACIEDTQSDPLRGAIYEYNADGSGRRLYARGLRNAEGLDFLPGSSALWVAVNNRDNVPYPFENDADGNGTNDAGQILPSYVDNNPPEPFTRVRDGGNYGWPFCNVLPNAEMSNLESAPDYMLNRNSSQFDCTTADRASKGIRAHSAPLGLSFLQGSTVPEAYRSGAAIALHGCWNCTTLSAGYKVVYFSFDAEGNAGSEIDLVTGFVTDPVARSLWGRPVDVIPDANGNILISDDYAGAIYQLYPKVQ